MPSRSPGRITAGLIVSTACIFMTVIAPGTAAEGKIKSVGSEYNARSPIGTNLTIVSDYSNEWIFTDPFKQSRGWISSTTNTWYDGRPLDLDDHGWVKSLLPGQLARTVMYWSDGKKHYPAGQYEILYDGDGKLSTFPQRVISQAPGKITLSVQPEKGGIALTIEATNPDNYIRNIRIVPPYETCADRAANACRSDANNSGHTKTSFNPAFLESVKSYRALRFMDWMDTNNSKITSFAQRPKVADAHYTVKGVPVEIMVELSNTLKTDPWFTMPHLADDDYITKFAEYVRDHLAPDRLVYIEYSNEVWNSLFEQSRYALEQGRKLRLSPHDYEAQLRFYSRRSVEVFRIWEQVFSGTSRLVRVIASHAANDWVSHAVLDYQEAYRSTDALAIAPYFGSYPGMPPGASQFATMSAEDLIADLQKRGLGEVREWLGKQKAIADKFGVNMIAYEGWQHLVGVGPAVNDERLAALFAAVNRHPAMKALYLAYLDDWKKSGGGLFVHYVNTSTPMKWGFWGASEYMNQPLTEAPKADALLTFMKNNPTD